MKVSDEKMVSLTYDLTVGEEGERELMEKATRERPLTFMFGMGMMLDAFERNVEGLRVGESFSFTLRPEEAYGEYIEKYVVELPKGIFEVDGKFDSERVSEGQTLPMLDSGGRQMMGSVLEVKEETVVMDFNHPLAGERLHFEGEVIDVHDASPEEIARLSQTGSCEACSGGEGPEGCGGDCRG
jgi:FKBP-type peptidyl-prolyl cis-trans isomerase SlyD